MRLGLPALAHKDDFRQRGYVLNPEGLWLEDWRRYLVGCWAEAVSYIDAQGVTWSLQLHVQPDAQGTNFRNILLLETEGACLPRLHPIKFVRLVP